MREHSRRRIDELLAQHQRAITPVHRELLQKLNQNGVKGLVEKVFPGMEFPRDVLVDSQPIQPDGAWRATALNSVPGHILIHMSRTQGGTGSIQLRYSTAEEVYVAGSQPEFTGQVGDELGDTETPLREALQRAKDNPQTARRGSLPGKGFYYSV